AAVNRFSNQVEIVLNQIHIVSPDDLDIVDFLPTTTQDIGGLKKELADLIDQVNDGHLKKLVKKVFDDPDLMKAYCLAPAAKNYHHGYLGGLLEHSVSVAKLAILMCDHYGGLDKSLLVTGALLHDIGKIREFNYTNRIDYSTEGRLVGHIVLGDKIVAGYADNIKGFPELVKLSVSHLILSHQGEPEYGAAVKPKTREAVILNVIDNADAKVNGWLQIANKYGDDVEWTDFQSMFGDFLYLGPAQSGAEKKVPRKPSKPKREDTSTLF
ncbi:MAG TPA: HD domain-containing protein, partial [Actinobacteria bacterium]|nr:HD domain-containing protein [Actinomycetota bacterium]